MTSIDMPLVASRPEFFRWSTCAVVVLAAHALVVLALTLRSEQADLEAGAPIITIELAPLAVALPAPVSELAPGPQQEQAESVERREIRPDEKPLEREQVAVGTAAPDPVVAVPPKRPEPPKQETRVEQDATPEVSVSTAPPSAPAPDMRAAAAPPGRVMRPSSSMMRSWQRLLLAHLERHKRFPLGARGEHGTTNLAFRIDREGRVVSSRVVRSSGSAALDEEGLALIRRAAPFPMPPRDIADDQLSFTVPILYGASRLN